MFHGFMILRSNEEREIEKFPSAICQTSTDGMTFITDH